MKVTKAQLQQKVAEQDRQIAAMEEKTDLLRRVCRIRALRNDLRGGAHVHTANAYRLFEKMMNDDAEIHRMLRESSEWIDRGMPRNGR